MQKLKIAITGSQGFIGWHIKQFLAFSTTAEVTTVSKKEFNDQGKLEQKLLGQEVIIHLAAINRHEDESYLEASNEEMVKQLIDTCTKLSITPHILFSSSVQEDQDNPYGRSKAKGHQRFINWAFKSGGTYSGLVIPNVFGPFCKPNYNSVVATFASKIANGDTPHIKENKLLSLIYIDDLVKSIWDEIVNPKYGKIDIPHHYQLKVDHLLDIFYAFKASYLEAGRIPDLADGLMQKLFLTFGSYIPPNYFPVKYKINADIRGTFVEIIRNQSGGQSSYSITKPGNTRGNHFHTRKVERFAVVQGEALIQLRKVDTDQVLEYTLSGEQPAYIDMPIWYTHNITNIGQQDLITLFWINEPYQPEDPDTFILPV